MRSLLFSAHMTKNGLATESLKPGFPGLSVFNPHKKKSLAWKVMAWLKYNSKSATWSPLMSA